MPSCTNAVFGLLCFINLTNGLCRYIRQILSAQNQTNILRLKVLHFPNKYSWDEVLKSLGSFTLRKS